MAQELHIVLVSNDPERAYPAMMLALGAATMGVKTTVYCSMGGLDVVKKGGAEKIEMKGMPPLEKFFRDARDAGVEFVACAPSMEMLRQMGVTEETVEPGVKLEEVIGFLNRALPAAKEGSPILFV